VLDSFQATHLNINKDQSPPAYYSTPMKRPNHLERVIPWSVIPSRRTRPMETTAARVGFSPPATSPKISLSPTSAPPSHRVGVSGSNININPPSMRQLGHHQSHATSDIAGSQTQSNGTTSSFAMSTPKQALKWSYVQSSNGIPIDSDMTSANTRARGMTLTKMMPHGVRFQTPMSDPLNRRRFGVSQIPHISAGGDNCLSITERAKRPNNLSRELTNRVTARLENHQTVWVERPL